MVDTQSFIRFKRMGSVEMFFEVLSLSISIFLAVSLSLSDTGDSPDSEFPQRPARVLEIQYYKLQDLRKEEHAGASE